MFVFKDSAVAEEDSAGKGVGSDWKPAQCTSEMVVFLSRAHN